MKEEFYILEGNLYVTLNEEILHCHKDDFVYVENGIEHELRTISAVSIMTIGCELKEERNNLQITETNIAFER